MEHKQLPNKEQKDSPLVPVGLGLITGFLAGSIVGKNSVPGTDIDIGGNTINVDNVFPDLWDVIFKNGGLSLQEKTDFAFYIYVLGPLSRMIDDVTNNQLPNGSMTARKTIREFFSIWNCRMINLPIKDNIQGYHAYFESQARFSKGKVSLINNRISVDQGMLLIRDFPDSELLDEVWLRCPGRNSIRQSLNIERIKRSFSLDCTKYFDLYKGEFDEEDSFSLRKFAALMTIRFGVGAFLQDERKQIILEMFKHFHLFYDADGVGAYLYAQRSPDYSKFALFLNEVCNIIE